jgi:hypothetical protein
MLAKAKSSRKPNIRLACRFARLAGMKPSCVGGELKKRNLLRMYSPINIKNCMKKKSVPAFGHRFFFILNTALIRDSIFALII